jgi:valyl-tRNA synthetase
VKITPAHDFNDFEVGKRHDLRDAINVLDHGARSRSRTMRTSSKGLEASGSRRDTMALDGLDRFEARKRIVAMMEELGFSRKIEPHTHMVPHGDRSGV